MRAILNAAVVAIACAAVAATTSPLVMAPSFAAPRGGPRPRTPEDEDALAQAEAKRRRKGAMRLRGAA